MATKSSVATDLPLDLPVLPQGWDYVPLAKIVNERRGISYGIVQPGSPVSNGVPIIRVNDIRDGRINESDTMRISPDIESKYNRTRLHGGELLLTLVGTVGESAIVPKRLTGWNVARAVAVLPCDGDIAAAWVHLCLRSVTLKHFMRIWCTTTVQATLNLRDVARLPIPVPPKRERERITEILTSLDDKIELNRRMNETLEAMARRLFKSWFIDFDPVHAKAALRREHPKLSNADLSRRALPNMTPEVAELFPDSFEDSSLGPIPKGWNAGTIPDAIAINPTRTLAKGTYAPWLEMSNMPTRSARALAWEHRAFGSGTKFVNGDTLVARITPCLENGKTAFVDFLDDGQVGAGSTEYIILRPKAPLPPVFAYLLARTDDFRQHLITNMTGTSGRQRAPAECLNKFPLVTPPTEIANCFGEATDNLFAQMKTIDEESLALTATRDRLLPRLLSGELGVADNGGSHEPT